MELELAAESRAPESTLDGRYRLRRPLAHVVGGGYVYAASHLFTKRPCAVKLLERGASDQVRQRMRREMDALACAQGSGVVEFLDAGESNGRQYIVLELLEGRTLAGLLAAKGKLGVSETVKVGIEIADALARCHERGIVHRDVKPSNVFVTIEQHVKLLDFGIAKIAETEDVPQPKLTQENSILGTPEYMSPEALLASPDVDERADQYSLGVTLYECLTGAVPFEGPYASILVKVSSATPHRPIRDFRDDVPQALLDIIARSLSQKREDRFGSVLEMHQALFATRAELESVSLFGLHAPENQRARDKKTIADVPRAKLVAPAARRRHPRAPYITLARIKRQTAGPVDGRVEEISEGGFQFIGDAGLPPGETITIRFALPATGRLTELRAIARWNRSIRGLGATGFEFLNPPEDAQAEIRRYVTIMCAE